jgi:hypothetical protein
MEAGTHSRLLCWDVARLVAAYLGCIRIRRRISYGNTKTTLLAGREISADLELQVPSGFRHRGENYTAFVICSQRDTMECARFSCKAKHRNTHMTSIRIFATATT